MAHRSEISDDGCVTIRLAIADRTYFDSNAQFLFTCVHVIVHNNCRTQHSTEQFCLSSLLSLRQAPELRFCLSEGKGNLPQRQRLPQKLENFRLLPRHGQPSRQLLISCYHTHCHHNTMPSRVLKQTSNDFVNVFATYRQIRVLHCVQLHRRCQARLSLPHFQSYLEHQCHLSLRCHR